MYYMIRVKLYQSIYKLQQQYIQWFILFSDVWFGLIDKISTHLTLKVAASRGIWSLDYNLCIGVAVYVWNLVHAELMQTCIYA